MNILEEFENVIFPTGTRYWEIHTDKSDYDFIMLWRDFKEIKAILDEKEIPYLASKIFNGIKFMVDEKYIDLIPLTSNEMKVWKMATYLMQTTLRRDEKFKEIIKNDKNLRVFYFQSLRASIRFLTLNLAEEDYES